MLPTKEEALRLLREAEKLNPGPWMDHSLVVADCAYQIAKRCPDMDAEKAYIVGALHDIGRRFSKKHLQHVIDGYRYMTSLGYDEAARVCMSHSFNTKNVADYIGKNDVTSEEYAQIERFIDDAVYDDYDRLIQLCDSLAMPSGPVDMDVRMDDVMNRYGRYPKNKRDMAHETKRYFEQKMGQNLYEVITTDKALWGL